MPHIKEVPSSLAYLSLKGEMKGCRKEVFMCMAMCLSADKNLCVLGSVTSYLLVELCCYMFVWGMCLEFQALLFLLALIVRAANSPSEYDSDDEFISPRSQIRQPFINRSTVPATGVPVAGSPDQRPTRNDAWSMRMREKVQSFSAVTFLYYSCSGIPHLLALAIALIELPFKRGTIYDLCTSLNFVLVVLPNNFLNCFFFQIMNLCSTVICDEFSN